MALTQLPGSIGMVCFRRTTRLPQKRPVCLPDTKRLPPPPVIRDHPKLITRTLRLLARPATGRCCADNAGQVAMAPNNGGAQKGLIPGHIWQHPADPGQLTAIAGNCRRTVEVKMVMQHR